MPLLNAYYILASVLITCMIFFSLRNEAEGREREIVRDRNGRREQNVYVVH